MRRFGGSRRVAGLALVVGVLAGGVLSGGGATAVAAAPGPPDAPEYWFDGWDVPGLWASGARGAGVVIAELDTGVQADVPGLAGKVLPGLDLGPDGGDGRVDRDTDRFGHGTAMASIMVADPGPFGVTGLAPDARVLPVALPLAGTVDAGGADQLPNAIRWAADHGARVISMSVGQARKPGTDPLSCPADEQAAVFHALEKGAVLVAAGGNEAASGSPAVDPGVCLGVVSVGAVDAGGRVADFSSRHPYLTLTAPGVGVASLSRVPGVAYSGDGTSQATALTAAALALALSAHPELTGPQLVTRLLASLTPPPGHAAGTHDDAYGWGTLAADRLVRDAAPAGAPDPVGAAAAPFLARYRAGLQAVSAPLPDPLPTRAAAASEPGTWPPAPGAVFWVAVGVGAVGLLLAAGAGTAALRRRTGRRPPPGT